MSTVHAPEQEGRRTQQSEGARPVPTAETLNDIEKAERAILNFQRQARRQETSDLDVANARAIIDPAIKAGLRQAAEKAREVRESLNVAGKVISDLETDAKDVTKAVAVFLRAAEEDLIIPPTHEPTLYVFNALVEKLHEQGDPTDRTAPSLHILISGILNNPEYVKFSTEGGPPTKFEQDLEEILKNPAWQGAEYFLNDLFLKVFNEHGENALPNITREQLRGKIIAMKAAGIANLQEQARRRKTEDKENNRQEEGYILNAIREDEDTVEGAKTLELYNAMESPRDFFNYYKNKYDQHYAALSDQNNPNYIAEEIQRKERAAKNVTEDIQKRIQFMMYRIYAQVLNGDPRKQFGQNVQDAAGLYGSNPQNIYNWLKRKVIRIKADLESVEEQFKAEAKANGDMPFFQFGNEEKEIFVQSADTKNKKSHRFIRESVVSSELKKSSFLGFVENLHIAMDAENDLLQAGINFNHLMLTGKLDQDQHSFFHQAGRYIENFLPTPRLDELYKLPYHEVVEAAKIALSSYYKKEFSKIGWKRTPELMQGMFEGLDRIQHELLHDMVHNFSRGENPVPPWAVKRAIIHARMHLSLVNMEMHALSSYAHAPINDMGNPTYRDPALKNLEVFKTWYAHEQWGVSDTSLKGMAFLPSPSKAWRFEKWFHEDVTAEGKEIADESLHIGRLSRVDRTYFDWDTAPNIMELNPMKMGSLEIQAGFRLKYPAMPWLTDLMDHLNNEEQLKLDKGETVITEGWKRLENVGINVLKMYKDNFLLGDENKHISLDEQGNIKHEAHMKNFFGYLYRRYFHEGVGKDSLSFDVPDGPFGTRKVKFSDINSDTQFWEQVIRPILTKPIVKGEGESDKGANVRNNKAKAEAIKGVVDQALTVMAFERMPVDFLTVEDPSRSQNGITLMSEIQREWITSSYNSEAKANDNTNKHNEHQIHALEHAMNDLIYVQQYARQESVKQMNSFVKFQNDNGSAVRNLFTRGTNAIRTEDRSDIDLSGGHGKKGYVIDEQVIRHALEDLYHGHDTDGRVDNAVKLYQDIMKKIVKTPTENKYELNPEVSDTRVRVKMVDQGMNFNDKDLREKMRAKYKEELKTKLGEARKNNIKTRLDWSGNELLSNETAFSFNDTAYQFLEFVRAGEGMIERSVGAVGNTQEAYKHFVTAMDDHGLLSALKKYYRNEDNHDLHHGIVAMRNAIKDEDGDLADKMSVEVLLNAMNVMRINSDAESKVVELAYQAAHRKRSAFSVVVAEGEENPLRREKRYAIVEEFLHSAQFPKRANLDKGEGVYEYKPTTFRQFMDNFGDIGEQVATAAENFLGMESGKLVRKKWAEMNGDGMRSREVASAFHIYVKYGGYSLLALLGIAALLLFVTSTYVDEPSGGGGGGGGHH